ncbi:Aryl-alcohol dehydrogenase [Serratia rubidaea]|uniref:Aryl-alcohol dehydrogenase n=1 Tax=Serratia rubidaea TaxID=61652 RepID=A0A447QRA2_SERRU|nr:Aryl-alcohol dehydrogenase [Serratia rubidaea]
MIDTTGEHGLIQAAWQRLRRGGTLALLTGGGVVKFSHDRRILSVIQGDAVPQQFIPYLIEQWRNGRFPFERLLRFYPFTAINQALAAAQRGEAIKAVIRFD